MIVKRGLGRAPDRVSLFEVTSVPSEIEQSSRLTRVTFMPGLWWSRMQNCVVPNPHVSMIHSMKQPDFERPCHVSVATINFLCCLRRAHILQMCWFYMMLNEVVKFAERVRHRPRHVSTLHVAIFGNFQDLRCKPPQLKAVFRKTDWGLSSRGFPCLHHMPDILPASCST